MASMMEGVGHAHEAIAVIVGVVGVVVSVLFFLQKFSVIMMSFEITDVTYMWFFAGFALLSSVILLFMTVGFLGVK